MSVGSEQVPSLMFKCFVFIIILLLTFFYFWLFTKISGLPAIINKQRHIIQAN
jgi:hypothetical protein